MSCGMPTPRRRTDASIRMLEDPTYESVVRWGNDRDSFVVLEVGYSRAGTTRETLLTLATEREIYEIHPPQTLQAQQLRQFRPAVEQVRLS